MAVITFTSEKPTLRVATEQHNKTFRLCKDENN